MPLVDTLSLKTLGVYTVKSRYNGSQGTNEFYALLPDCVIAKMTIPDYLLCFLSGN